MGQFSVGVNILSPEGLHCCILQERHASYFVSMQATTRVKGVGEFFECKIPLQQT